MNFPTKILPSKSCWIKNFFTENPLPVRVEDNFFISFPTRKPRSEIETRLVNFLFMAEKVGFEPTVAFATPLFESGTFNHSDTSPQCK